MMTIFKSLPFKVGNNQLFSIKQILLLKNSLHMWKFKYYNTMKTD